MLSSADIAQLKILIVGLTRSEKNALAVILPRRLQRPVCLTEGELPHPDFILLNLDSQASIKQWPLLKSRYPHVPLIGLSCDEQKFKSQGLILLGRPLKAEQLIEVIEKKTNTTKPAKKLTPWKKERSIAASTNTQPPAQYFDPEEKIIGVFLSAWKRARQDHLPVLVEGFGGFLFDPKGQVFGNKNLKMLHALGLIHIDPQAPLSFSLLNLSREKAERWKTNQAHLHAYSTEAFLWEVACYCSRGALPKTLDSKKPLRLKRWPNCVLLQEPLKAITVAAFFSRPNRCIIDLHQQFPHAQNALNSHIAAAYLLGFLEPEDKKSVNRSIKIDKKYTPQLLGQLAKQIIGRLWHKSND